MEILRRMNWKLTVNSEQNALVAGKELKGRLEEKEQVIFVVPFSSSFHDMDVIRRM